VNRVQRIVLIDDSEPDNVFHEMVLAAADFEGDLKSFDLPQAGIDYLLQQPDGPVDLVLLDINMPAIDGWAVVQALQSSLPRWPDMRIYMLTSSASPEDKALAASTPGVSGFLTKPLEPDQARQLVGS